MTLPGDGRGAHRATPLDTITLTGLRASAFHGVFENERRDGQVFIVDVTVSLDFAAAAARSRCTVTSMTKTWPSRRSWS